MLLKYVLFYKVSNNQLLLYELTEPNCKLDRKSITNYGLLTCLCKGNYFQENQ